MQQQSLCDNAKKRAVMHIRLYHLPNCCYGVIMRNYLLFLAIIFMCAPLSTRAQTLHNTVRDWRVFSTMQGGAKMCYIASMPVEESGSYRSRGKPFMIVTHRSATLDEVSVSSGYPYREGKDVSVTIGKHTHPLFAQGERAWAKDSKTDMLMVDRMKEGSRLSVKGTSKLGTYSIDTYSLSGFSAAYSSMKSLCR
jgi:Invasion associated locus B (IalB) protein